MSLLLPAWFPTATMCKSKAVQTVQKEARGVRGAAKDGQSQSGIAGGM